MAHCINAMGSNVPTVGQPCFVDSVFDKHCEFRTIACPHTHTCCLGTWSGNVHCAESTHVGTSLLQSINKAAKAGLPVLVASVAQQCRVYAGVLSICKRFTGPLPNKYALALTY